MMKRKKKWFSIAAVLMVVVLLAGCSSAELKMLSGAIRYTMINDARMTGTLTVTPDKAGIQKGLDQLKAKGLLDQTKYDRYGREIWDLSQKGPSLIESLSSHTYRMDYEVHRRQVDGVLMATVEFFGAVDGTAVKPLGQLVMKGEEEVLCSSDLLLNGYAMIAEAVREDGCEALLFSEEFEKQLKDTLNGVDFVRTDLTPASYEDDGEGDEDSGGDSDREDDASDEYDSKVNHMNEGLKQLTASPEAMKDLSALIVGFIENTFRNYSSGLVRTVGGGQEFSATLRQCADALFAGLDSGLREQSRFTEDLAALFGSFDQLMRKHGFWGEADYAVFVEEYLWEYEELMDVDDPSAIEELRSTARLMQGFVNTGIMNFEDSQVVMRITEREGGFDESFALALKWKGTDLISIEEKVQLRPETSELILPGSKTPLEDMEFSAKLQAIIRSLNPAVRAEISWYEEDWMEYPWYEQNEAEIFVNYVRETDGGFLQSNIDFYHGYVIDGSLYVPLREVATQFGETVGYDKEEHSAYVQRDGVRTLMKGIVRDGVTYVKIRDFDRLGYEIDYQKSEDGYPLVFVSRGK